jgi:hypothetical protein
MRQLAPTVLHRRPTPFRRLTQSGDGYSDIGRTGESTHTTRAGSSPRTS